MAGLIALSLGISSLRFNDRVAAGHVLADVLRSRIKRYVNDPEDIIVLGIPRGGVIVADVVATKLSASLGIIIAKKLLAPGSEEDAIGAITYDGTIYLDQNTIKNLQVCEDYIERVKAEAMEEMRRRKIVYSGSGKVHENLKIRGKTAIIVDDGAATGATLIAASRSIRRLEPKRIVIGVPVAPRETVRSLKREADLVEVISSPSHNFKTVGQFYRGFIPTTHEHVIQILRRRSLC